MLRRGLTVSCFHSTKLPNSHLSKSVLGGWRERQYASNANAAAEAEKESEAEAEADASDRDGRRVKGKRIPKAERQAMLKLFVSKYRAMNGGAFPTASQAQKELGGSYYVVKSIIQEIQYTAKLSVAYPAPVQEQVTEIESLIRVEENSTSDNTQNVSGLTFDTHLPGQEKVGEIEALCQVQGKPTCRVSANASVQNDSEAIPDADLSGLSGKDIEAKEEFQKSATVEVLSEEVITKVSDSDLAATQSDTLKEDPGECFYNDLHELRDGNEEVKQNLYDSISTECHPLEEKFQVVSHSRDNRKNYETDEAEADRHDFVANDKDLPIGETNRAPLPSFGDTENMKKQEHVSEDEPDYDDSNHKTVQYEEIPQPDRFSKDLPSRQTDADAEPSRKSTLWGNVKSLANGIMSIFKNL